MKKIAYMIGCMALVALAACSGRKTQPVTDSAAPRQDSALAAPVDEVAEAEPADSLPTVIDFYAVWCGPCKMIAPVFDELKETYGGRVNFVSVDVDENPYDARRFGVEAMPTFVFLDKEGNELDRIVGADADALREATKALAAQKTE